MQSTTLDPAARLARARPAACAACHARQRCWRVRASQSCARQEAGASQAACPDAHPLPRRLALAAAAASVLLRAGLAPPAGAEEGEELVRFEDKKRTYGLRRPAAWEQKDKAGADVLFKAPALRATDLGVTVSPVRIQRLEQLGDVQALGERLLAAERKKESTQSAELLQQGQRTGASGTVFFEYDYTISTTRGDKRIISAVGVADGKLYIVNGSVKCEGGACKEATPLVRLVQQSVASFDLLR